jgi:Rieske Fe-S protein
VLVGYETFAGPICQLAAGQVLTPGEAAALLDEAVVERVVFDGPSRVIDVGQSRLFTGALRRAIQVRDQTCTHDGCHVPAERCEIDHVIPAAVHGPTSQDNGVLRCPFHHHQRHRPARPPPP